MRDLRTTDVPLDDQQLEKYAGNQRRDSQAASYATKYDRELHKRISSHFERRAIRRALALTGARHATVLDVPCGAGRLTPLLQPVSSRLLSCDYSRAMLRQFERAHRAPCFVGSAFELPFADRAFDVVFSARLSHHIASDERRAAYLREVMRTSARWVIVTIFDRDSLKSRLREISRRFTGKRGKHAFARSELEQIAAAAGFRIAGGEPLSRLFSGHVFYVLRRDGA
jgi:SAM-dependent methyltransferase